MIFTNTDCIKDDTNVPKGLGIAHLSVCIEVSWQVADQIKPITKKISQEIDK